MPRRSSQYHRHAQSSYFRSQLKVPNKYHHDIEWESESESFSYISSVWDSHESLGASKSAKSRHEGDRHPDKKTRTIFSSVSNRASKSQQLNADSRKSGDGKEVRHHPIKSSSSCMRQLPIEEDDETEDDDDTLPSVLSNKISSKSLSCKGESQNSIRSSYSCGGKLEADVQEVVKKATNGIVDNLSKAEELRKSSTTGIGSSVKIEHSQKDVVKGCKQASRDLVLHHCYSENEDNFSKVLTIHNPTSYLYAFKICSNKFAKYTCTATPEIGLLDPGSKVLVEIKANKELLRYRKEVAEKGELQLNIFPPLGCIENDKQKLEKCFQKMCTEYEEQICSQTFKSLIFLIGGKSRKSDYYVSAQDDSDDDEKESVSGEVGTSSDEMIKSSRDEPTNLILKRMHQDTIMFNTRVEEARYELMAFKWHQLFLVIACILLMIFTSVNSYFAYAEDERKQQEAALLLEKQNVPWFKTIVKHIFKS